MDLYASQLLAESEKDQQPHRATPSPCLTIPNLLESIFAQLPVESLLSAALVSRQWNDSASRELFQDVHLDTAEAVEEFSSVLATRGQYVRGFYITRATTSLLPTLPFLTPNLTTLTITSHTHLSHTTLAALIPSWPRLRHLVIIGQDLKSVRRRRLSDPEPEGDVGKALRAIADIGRAGLRLKSLKILATPLKLSTLDFFLEHCGEGLEVIAVEGCGIGAGLAQLVDLWCPRLKQGRLDSLSSASAPPSTPRHDVPPFSFDRTLPLSLPSQLTTLHLSSLPSTDPAAFAPFSTHDTLRSLSLSHCDVSSAHLSFFTRITRLVIIACPNIASIPVFVDRRGRPDVGAGCKELRKVSVLGGRGLSLGNLWELAVLGREEISEEERGERKRLGLGGQGLVKLTIDGAEGGNELLYTSTGIFFSMPPGLGSPPLPTEVRTTLPSSLLPPPHLLPFFTTNILSRDLPSTILLQTLAMASDLEELGLFGSIHRPPPPVVVTEPTTHWNRTKQLVTEVLISLLGLCHPNSSPVAPEWPPVPLLANIKIPLSSLGQSKGLPVPQGEGGGGKGKRLSEEDIEWLKAVGKVQQVYL